MPALATKARIDRPTTAARTRTAMAICCPLRLLGVALRTGQHLQRFLHHVGDGAVEVLGHPGSELAEGRRAAEVDLRCAYRIAAAAPLFLGKLGAPLGLDARLAGLALLLARRAGEQLGEGIDLLFVGHGRALAALRTAAFTSPHRLSISSAAFGSFSGPVLPVVMALMNWRRWATTVSATGTFHDFRSARASSTSLPSCRPLALMTTK